MLRIKLLKIINIFVVEIKELIMKGDLVYYIYSNVTHTVISHL